MQQETTSISLSNSETIPRGRPSRLRARLASLILLTSLLLSNACSSTPETGGKSQSAEPQEKIFNEPFEDVWRATLLSLANYPIKVNNQDAGILETERIKGEQAWVSPNQKKAPTGGFRYSILVRVVKGRGDKGPAAKVTILKQGEIQRDFFSTYEKFPSDGLEELSLMYRIERELAIEKALRKAANRN